MSKHCQICRVATDLLIASYGLKDGEEVSDAILKYLAKHALQAKHQPNEGWVLI